MKAFFGPGLRFLPSFLFSQIQERNVSHFSQCEEEIAVASLSPFWHIPPHLTARQVAFFSLCHLFTLLRIEKVNLF